MKKDLKKDPKSDLKNQLEEMTEHAKRAMADLQNLKRRHEEERKLIMTIANIDLIKALLPVMDNMERALAHAPKKEEKWVEGMKMNITQLKKTLEDAGLKEIEAIGMPFDPELHEALAQGEGEKDIVTEVLEKGYKLGNKVIRHAKVTVGTGEKEEKNT